MSLLVGGLVVLGGLLAAAGVALVRSTRRARRSGLAALADRRGWDHQERPRGPLEPPLERLVPEAQAVAGYRVRDLLAGPTTSGPFRLYRLAPATRRPTMRGATLIHIRTPLASPGLLVLPRPAGVARQGKEAQGFHVRFQVEARDPGFAAIHLDKSTCQFLASPQRPVRLDWTGHDLVVMFPFTAHTPRAVESLVSWSTALADSLDGEGAGAGGAAWKRPRGTPGGVPPDVDLMIP